MDRELDANLSDMLDAIAKRIADVYHMSDTVAYDYMRGLAFYEILTEEASPYRGDAAEVNFERMQNEIEYGSWNRGAAVEKPN